MELSLNVARAASIVVHVRGPHHMVVSLLAHPSLWINAVGLRRGPCTATVNVCVQARALAPATCHVSGPAWTSTAVVLVGAHAGELGVIYFASTTISKPTQVLQGSWRSMCTKKAKTCTVSLDWVS